MSKKSIVPFGPQHPVLPEPIHLDLVIEDEKVLNAIPSIGFIHRGWSKKKILTKWSTLQNGHAVSAALVMVWAIVKPLSMS